MVTRTLPNSSVKMKVLDSSTSVWLAATRSLAHNQTLPLRELSHRTLKVMKILIRKCLMILIINLQTLETAKMMILCIKKMRYNWKKLRMFQWRIVLRALAGRSQSLTLLTRFQHKQNMVPSRQEALWKLFRKVNQLQLLSQQLPLPLTRFSLRGRLWPLDKVKHQLLWAKSYEPQPTT